jgi:hypothetical protein
MAAQRHPRHEGQRLLRCQRLNLFSLPRLLLFYTPYMRFGRQLIGGRPEPSFSPRQGDKEICLDVAAALGNDQINASGKFHTASGIAGELPLEPAHSRNAHQTPSLLQRGFMRVGGNSCANIGLN